MSALVHFIALYLNEANEMKTFLQGVSVRPHDSSVYSLMVKFDTEVLTKIFRANWILVYIVQVFLLCMKLKLNFVGILKNCSSYKKLVLP